MHRLVNPFEQRGSWYKASLHNHSTTSDGQASLAEHVVQHRRAGYHILAITDHRLTNDVSGLSNQKMLVVSGMEYHPDCPASPLAYHLVALNVPHGFAFTDAQNANNCIAEVRTAGGETILAHPHWCGHEYQTFKHLEGLAAVEVYNSVCDGMGRPSSENEWDNILDDGIMLPAVGVDDSHFSRDGFECWTWLKMPSLSVANFLNALRRGACYASCGPKIHDFRIRDGKVRLRCSPAAKIHFVSGPSLGARRRAEEGRSITAFSIDVPDWPFIRATVTDAAGRKAWANPILL